MNDNIFDIHRKLDCGIPIHGYTIYYKIEYDKSIKIKSENISARDTVVTWETPKGTISETLSLADDFSTAHTVYPVKTIEDIPVLEYILEHTTVLPDYAPAQKAIDTVGDLGYVNMGTFRSPLGHLIIDYMGIENLTYAFVDNKDMVEGLLETLHQFVKKTWDITSEAPGQFTYHCDNVDEYLLNPKWYEKYCLPVYQELTERLHRNNKIILTHMDGRIRNLLPFVKETGFDVIDGCTPAPLNDFEPKELYAALGKDQVAYCGVPAPFFIQDMTDEQVLDVAKGILDAMDGKGILMVGDIMPHWGNIELVRKMAELVKHY